MSNLSPYFPVPEPHHFSDYGFDPQIDYFQVLEEARKQRREACAPRAMDLHFKLQKPISKDDSSSKRAKKTRKRWWRNAALLFFKFHKWAAAPGSGPAASAGINPVVGPRTGSISGPVYITESLSSGSSTPCRTATRPSYGELMECEAEIPYMSLRDLNMYQERRRIPTAATGMPIYLVT